MYIRISGSKKYTTRNNQKSHKPLNDAMNQEPHVLDDTVDSEPHIKLHLIDDAKDL